MSTARDVQAALSQTPNWGDHTELYDAILLALEQDNFCDFEVGHTYYHLFVIDKIIVICMLHRKLFFLCK